MTNYKERKLFTCESVSEGHPDKVCDQIADAILDACLEQDSNSHVACEVFAVDNYILIGGEITSKAKIDVDQIAKDVLKDIGYNSPSLITDYHTVTIDNKIRSQSPEINVGVSQLKPEEIGAGDQGMMFGYATNETKGYMPLAIVMAHKLVREATRMRKAGEFPLARPDMKSQITIDYTDPNNIKVDTVIMSIQTCPLEDKEEFDKFVYEQIMQKVVRSFGLNTDFKYYINSAGTFVLGGPAADTGLTGRKIIVDTYGGYAQHGGGSFSGKDPTKVDRTGAYMARYIAKNLVAAQVADKICVQLSYGIGLANPISIAVDTYGTSPYSDSEILNAIHQVFDCRPGMISKAFSLTKPSFKYRKLSNYGHFGRPDVDLPWEKTDKVEEIKKILH